MKALTIFIALLVLVLFSACAQETETPRQEAMPPAVEVQKTSEQKLEDVRNNIQELKTELAQAGEYACCIEEPCNFCLLHEGSCPCLKELENGEHVCTECYAGWQQGKGAVENMKKEQVTTSFVKHEHKQ